MRVSFESDLTMHLQAHTKVTSYQNADESYREYRHSRPARTRDVVEVIEHHEVTAFPPELKGALWQILAIVGR